MNDRRPLLALSEARIKQFLREPGSLFWTFVFPLLITVALGIAFRTQGPPRSRVAVVADGPDGATAASLIAATLGDGAGLDVQVVAPAEAARRLRTGDVVLAVEPTGPPGPGHPVVYRYDPTRPDAIAVRRLVDDRLQRHAGRGDPIRTRDETAVAQGARYIDWLIPGLLGMQLLNGQMWGTSFNIVNSRVRKALKRLAATPMRRGDYLLSFRMSGLIFVPLQMLVLFVFAHLTFGVTNHGSVVAAVLLALLGSWSFAGLGLLCASRAQNSETANGLINVVTLPMMVLSGVFFSSSRFPSVLQPAIRLLPLSAFNEAMRAIVNDGASIFSQGFPIAVLAVWALVTAVVAVKLFRWT